MNKRLTPHNSALYVKLGLLLVVFYVVFFIVQSLAQSILFSPKDRITIVFYGDKTRLLSLSRSSSVHYTLTFDNEIEVGVPGGYGRYRIGALGRLSELEKKPIIIQKAFSSATSSYADYYFLPKSNTVHDIETIDPQSNVPKLSLMTVLFAKQYSTNASLFDRLYLFFLFLNKRNTDFINLSARTLSYGKGNVFSEEAFQKKYKGFFYQTYLRNEEKNVKIVYRTYRSAKTLSRIIEGEGIRVVDLEYQEKDPKLSRCIVRENGHRSKTAQFLVNTFHCSLERGDVSGADISFTLDKIVEGEWE